MILKRSNDQPPRYAWWLASSFVFLVCCVGPTLTSEQTANAQISPIQEMADDIRNDARAAIMADGNSPEDFETQIEPDGALAADNQPPGPDYLYDAKIGDYRAMNAAYSSEGYEALIDEFYTLTPEHSHEFAIGDFHPLDVSEFRPLNFNEYRPVNAGEYQRMKPTLHESYYQIPKFQPLNFDKYRPWMPGNIN